MSKKKIVELVVKGEVDFNSVTVRHIEGGFGEGQRIIAVNDVATIHGVRVNDVQDLINNNLDEFEFGIDIIDLMSEDFKADTIGLGLKTSNRQKYCYMLSEQGYLALTCLMRTPKAREIRKQFRRKYFRLQEENQKLRKYARSNNRFTTKCLLNLDGQKETESDFLFLMNNTVRNEVERIIELVGVKAGVIAVNAKLKENTISNWRTRRTSLDIEDLEKIINVISKFKEFVE